MKNRLIFYFWVCLAVILFGRSYISYGAQPKLYTLKTINDFLPGKMDHLSLLFDGRLCLAPTAQLLCDTGDPYIWDIARDSRGNLFLATGNDGRVYKVTSKGDTSLFFDAPEFGVYALAIDKQDRLYAATSPKGKVYRIKADGNHEVFFQTQDTYIWDVELDAHGNLLVATGSKARVFRVKADGNSQLICESEAEHIRCLAIDSQNRVYWGTASPGIIYRLQANDQPFAVYDPCAEEVHKLAIAKDGKIFAAVFAEQERGRLAPPRSQEEKPRETIESDGETVLSSLSMLIEETMGAEKAKTQLLMLTPEGYATNLWNQNEDVQTILIADDEVMVGSSKNGRLFRVNRAGEASLVSEMGQTHISALLRTNDDKLYVATSNMGQCFLLHPTLSERGSYQSPTIDAKNMSNWGVLRWQGKGLVSFSTRSGNSQQPEKTWSHWEKVENDQGVLRIKSPIARFLQLRCELHNQKGEAPEVTEITVSYLQKNLPPEIGEIIIHPVDVFLGTVQTYGDDKGIVDPQPVPKGEDKKGYRSVSWKFSDPNEDPLLFDLYYRKNSEKLWHPLVKQYAGYYYSWDTNQFQDGIYYLQIVASDACDLPLGEGLSSEKISREFTVDNTAPVIKITKQQNRSAEVLLTFSVCDALTPLEQVLISLNAQGWQQINPDDGICDSLCENFTLKKPKEIKVEEIAIKAIDRCHNISVQHTTPTDNK